MNCVRFKYIDTNIFAGTGALAENIFEVNNENRGSTFFTGSDGDWDTCPSVLNFIKNYNPRVQVTKPETVFSQILSIKYIMAFFYSLIAQKFCHRQLFLYQNSAKKK